MSYYLGYTMRQWKKDKTLTKKEEVVLRDLTMEVQGVLDKRCTWEEKHKMLELFKEILIEHLNPPLESNEEEDNSDEIFAIG